MERRNKVPIFLTARVSFTTWSRVSIVRLLPHHRNGEVVVLSPIISMERCLVFTYKGVYIQREDSQALRKTFLGYRLTKCLFSFQEDLYRFQREGSTYNYKFSNVNAPQKGGGWAETNLLISPGRSKCLIFTLYVSSRYQDAHPYAHTHTCRCTCVHGLFRVVAPKSSSRLCCLGLTVTGCVPQFIFCWQQRSRLFLPFP